MSILTLLTATPSNIDGAQNGIIGVLAFVVIVCVGAFAFIRNKKNAITKSNDLVEYLITECKEKIIPYVTGIALKDELSSMTYNEFVSKCIDKFAEMLYSYIDDNDDIFKIPDNLKPFFNKQTIINLATSVCKLKEIEELLKKTYNNYWKGRGEEMESIEKEVSERNKELGDVGDDIKLTPATDVEEPEVPTLDPETAEELSEIIDDHEVTLNDAKEE